MALWNDSSAQWNDAAVTWNDTAATDYTQPKVEIDLSGTWTDITSYVYYRDGIKITRGIPNESSQAQPGSCAFTLNNRDHRFSPRNPTSPYYGQIGRNTPVRVSMPNGSTYAQLPGPIDEGYTISTPDDASLDITGDIDVRIDLNLNNWSTPPALNSSLNSTVELAGKYTRTGNQRSWYLAIPGLVDGSTNGLSFVWSPDGTSASGLQFHSTLPLPIPGNGRLAIRATLDVNNGLGGYTVTFYTSNSISGTWTQFDQTVTTAGTTSIFNSTAPLELGNLAAFSSAVEAFEPAHGNLYAFQLLNGIGGTAVANPDFTTQTAGATSFTDAAGRTWSLTGNAAISDRDFRFLGEISTWPTRWDTGGFDIHVPVEAAGIIRRLGQGNRPLGSALRRRIPNFAPIAYWPMEDGSTATQAASPVSGVRPMMTTGFTFAQDSSLPGSGPLPTLTGTAPTMSAIIPAMPTTVTAWTIEMVYNLASAPATNSTFLRVRSTGTVTDWKVQLNGTTATISGLDDTGASVFSTPFTVTQVVPYGQWIRLTLSVHQTGGNVDWAVYWTTAAEAFDVTANSFAGTVGVPKSVVSPASGFSSAISGMAIGHIGVFDSQLPNAYYQALSGFTSEYAGQRMTRLASEESTPLVSYGQFPYEEQVGPQLSDKFLTLMQQCADADGGFLSEKRDYTALRYRDRRTLMNQTVALTVDYANSALIAPIEPTGDDFLIRNQVTVTRTNGSFGFAEDTTSVLSTQNPPNGVGLYDDSVTLNMYDDSRLDNIAGWKVHVGTWDEERYPVITLGLHSDATLIPTAAAVEVGDRIQLTNPPAWLPPDTIDLMVVGYSEVFDQFTWFISYNCVPYGPYVTARATAAGTSTTQTKADSTTATLNATMTTTATSVTVAITAGSALWTTSGVDFDVIIGGERMTIGSVSGASSPQTFSNITRSVNGVVKTHASGETVRLFSRPIVAL